MAVPVLAETLLALIESLDAAPGTGVVVTSMELEVPLEATASIERGDLVIRAGVPHTRWVSGVLPPVHKGKLVVELVEEPSTHGEES
ncbi:MAG: hypothetical protein HOW73_24000 [Polyangiaceae bacterium]|nr:hypothetical protein [Polyangiaceae bacterium]